MKEEYQESIRRMMRKVPVMRTQQLVLAIQHLSRKNVSEDVAMIYLTDMQSNGYLCMSIDGWAMTKGAYTAITGDNRYIRLEYKAPFIINFEIDTLVEKYLTSHQNYYKNLVDSMWVTVELLPLSEEFIATNFPWSISFIIYNKRIDKSYLYQITNISKRKEDAHIELLKDYARVDDEDLRKTYRRIAIIEDEKHAWKVPHLGFEFICVIDKNTPTGFRIVETRNEDEMWNGEEDL